MSNSCRETLGRIHSIETFGAVDGPGVRFVAFFQGCPLRCAYCHNPDSWEFSEGKKITAGELIDQIVDYRSYIQKGGVTLSGGEPMAQPEFCLALLHLCKDAGFHTAVDTSGALPLEVIREVVDAADLLLLDIKDIDADDCKALTGRDNKNALALLDYCEATQKSVWIRHVCIPTLTLKVAKLTRLASFLSGYRCIQKVELIPFHQMGMYKWEFINQPYSLKHIPTPTKAEMEEADIIFKEYHLPL